ncbi:MAG: hypothetical protein ACK4UJ_07600 [Leptonema sp. (in: bacteria)]
MHEWIYEELDPNLQWKVYYTKKKVLKSFTVATAMPENGLSAEGLLNKDQFNKVIEIRKRKFAKVFDQFEKIS